MRTTDENHKRTVAALWVKITHTILIWDFIHFILLFQGELEKNGYIYKGKHEGWYAVSDEAFYASNQVQEVVDEKTGEKYMVK